MFTSTKAMSRSSLIQDYGIIVLLEEIIRQLTSYRYSMTNDRFSLSTIHPLSFSFQSMFTPRLIRRRITKATRISEQERKKEKIDIPLYY
jgi:hypothetical protein